MKEPKDSVGCGLLIKKSRASVLLGFRFSWDFIGMLISASTHSLLANKAG